MEILNLIEEFSEHKNNRDIGKCFQCLVEYKNFAMKFKNYSLFEKFEIEEIKSKNISFIWNQIKFEKSLLEYNFKDLHESFTEIYKSYFSKTRELNEDFWENIANLLKPHNSKIYEINILKLEVEIIKEILTSYNYSLPIPISRKVQKIIELSLVASKDPFVLRTLNKYFHLVEDKKIEANYQKAFPDSKNREYLDNFSHSLKEHHVRRDIRIDVLVDKVELPLSKEIEEKTRYILEKSNKDIFSYLVPSRSLSKINIVEYYIAEAQYDEATQALESHYDTTEKDSNYYYLKSYIAYRLKGALSALREIQKYDIDSLILANKEFLSFVTRLRAEVLIQGEPSED